MAKRRDEAAQKLERLRQQIENMRIGFQYWQLNDRDLELLRDADEGLRMAIHELEFGEE